MKRKVLILCSVLFMAYGAVFLYSLGKQKSNDPLLIHDVSRLVPVHVNKIVKTQGEDGIKKALQEANKKNLPVSIAGSRHSQGGHIFYPNALLLDMKSYSKILSLDKEKKIIRVQSGASWADIQNYINPYHLSIIEMQSSNIFTVGGSMSVNAHGRDTKHGTIIETIRSFRLLQSNGKVINVSREQHPELFSLVIGGFGLFGVILDVDIQLTDNATYQTKNDWMSYKDYPTYLKNVVLRNPNIDLHIARLSSAPEAFLTDMYATNYIKTKKKPVTTELQEEKNVALNKFLFGLSRYSDTGKNLVWRIQKICTLQINRRFLQEIKRCVLTSYFS